MRQPIFRAWHRLNLSAAGQCLGFQDCAKRSRLDTLVPTLFPLYRLSMPDDRPLTPADPAELEYALAHALQFDGRRQFKLSGESMAKITAAHLARSLAQSGFVVMRKPASDPSKSAPWGPPGGKHLTE